MGYSVTIEKILKAQRAAPGDRVRVTKEGVTYEGTLLPRAELADPNYLVVKLDSGYNLGVRFEKGAQVKLVQKGKVAEYKPKAAAPPQEGKPTVSILGCGGTIAARVDYRTGAVYPAFDVPELLTSFPDLKDIANIQGRKLFFLLSEDMTPFHWQKIAEETAKEIKAGVDGVVLMHGTDTMTYTAAALSFMLHNLPVPVIMVGSQRSSDRGSSDNEMNLLSSALAATSEFSGVGVCMHGSLRDDYCLLHQGTKVRKMHTSRRDTFRSIDVLPWAKIFYKERRIEWTRKEFPQRDKSRKPIVDTKLNPNVALVWSYPGIKPEMISGLAKNFDGVVIAGTGMGHVPTTKVDKWTKPILPAIKSLVSSGIPVVMAPQTIYGRLFMDVYSAGRDLQAAGVIGNGADWTPECALVKLMWVLGHTKKMDRVREMMMANLAGEISVKDDNRAFLA